MRESEPAGHADEHPPSRGGLYPVIVGLTLVVVFLLLLDLWDLSLFRGQFDPERFGTVGDWFVGLLTAVALGVAVLAYIHQRSMDREAEAKEQADAVLRKKAEDAEAKAERRRRAQALYTWVVDEYDHTGKRVVAQSLAFHNATRLPVYRYRVLRALGEVIASSDAHGPRLPGESAIRLNPGHSIPIMEVLRLEFIGDDGNAYARTGDGDISAITWNEAQA